MNAFEFHRTLAARATRGAAVAAFLAAASSLPAAELESSPAPLAPGARVTLVAFDQPDSSEEPRRFVVGAPNASDVVAWSDGRSVELRIEDGAVTVRIDGETVPANRIVDKDGRITVLDENGNAIESIVLSRPRGLMNLQFGDDDGQLMPPGAVIALEEPKVMMGINLGEPDRALLTHLKLAPGTTTMITSLYEGLPAHAAGFREFDVITAIDGKSPADPKSLRDALAAREAGDAISFDVIQAGERKRMTVTLAAYDREAMEAATLIGRPADHVIDWSFGPEPLPGNLAPGLREYLGRMPELEDIFIDEHDNVFELFPGDRPRVRIRERDLAPENNERAEIDTRLGTLDERLEALERMLDELLERARGGGERGGGGG